MRLLPCLALLFILEVVLTFFSTFRAELWPNTEINKCGDGPKYDNNSIKARQLLFLQSISDEATYVK